MTTRVVKNMLYKGVVGYVLDTGVIYKKRDAREDLGNPTRVANGEMPHKQNMVYGKEKKKEIETVKQGSSNQRLRSRLMASGANSADVAEE